MNSSPYNLSWLRSPPEDIRDRLKTASLEDIAGLQSLLQYRLNDNHLRKISGLMRTTDAPPQGLHPYNLVILSNANCEFVNGAIEGTGLRHNVWINSQEEAMGQVAAAALNPASPARADSTDGVLVALTYHAFLSPENPADIEGAEKLLGDMIGEIEMIAAQLKDSNKATLIVQTVALPSLSVFGAYDLRVAGTLRSIVDRFNRYLRESEHHIIDIAAVADIIGLENWNHDSQWHWAKTPFAQSYLPLYADHIARYIGALCGKSKKCLVLDLDNTLWGGVIGDDGLEGIALGQNSPRGEAYIALQKYALALKNRGIVLAVCSKNEEENARLPFQKHPDMLIREDDIAVFVANWNDKASNINAIAEALTLTPDSFVFLDDNPAEREILRRDMPMVAVPEVPNDDPTLYPLLLSAAGYFEAAGFTENDAIRAKQYSDNAKRTALKTQVRDITEYLASLEMELVVNSFVPEDQPRVSQLIGRSNQFNLTTRRYTEEEVAHLEADKDSLCFSFRLRDKFGDNGIVCIVICKDQGEGWEIDTWLMSCRVLQRQVEQAVLNVVAGAARAAGKSTLTGVYLPTAKNAMVKEHYKTYGFTLSHEDADGGATWTLDLARFEEKPVPMAMTDLATPQTRQKAVG